MSKMHFVKYGFVPSLIANICSEIENLKLCSCAEAYVVLKF